MTENTPTTVKPKQIHLPKVDFSDRTIFPGSIGNNFDKVIRGFELVQRIPAPLFLVLLFGIAYFASRFDLKWAVLLWIFFLSDWLLLLYLPISHRTFGPVQPPVLMLAICRSIFWLLPFPLAFTAEITGIILVVYGFWFEPVHLTTTRLTYHLCGFSPERPLRVMHISDLHVERFSLREKRVLDSIKREKPDLILITGDILNLSYLEDQRAQYDARTFLQSISAPKGVYFVTGSPAVDLPEIVQKILQGLPLRWLQDEIVTIQHENQEIDLVGLSCSHKPFIDGPRLTKILSNQTRRPRILLYHSPDLAPEADEAGIDLQLSGHTHGGQVRFPFIGAIFSGSLYGRKLQTGAYQIGKMTLYISRGLGLEGSAAPRVRFLCPPEVILWELTK